MNEKISKKIMLVNFIMTLSIVLYHCYAWYTKVPMYESFDKGIFNAFNYVADSMGTVATGVFFLISGFLLYYNCNNSKDIKEKIKKRAKSLIIPFVIWNLFAFVYLFFREGFILPFENLKDLIIHLTIDPYNIPLWYIFALIVLLIPAMLIIKLKGKKITSLLIYFIICIITLCYCNLESLKAIRIFEIQRIVQYMPLYFLGVFAGMNYSDFVLNEKIYSKKINIISFFILISCALIRFSISNSIIKEILITLESIFIWFAIPCVFNIFNKELSPSIVFKCSFMIYVLHCPFILDMIDKILTPIMLSVECFYPIQIVLIDLIIVSLVWIVSVLITLVLKRILNKKTFNIITGGRV